MDSLPVVTWYVLAGLIVLVLPGAAWLVWFPAPETDFTSRLAEAAGFSLALTALTALGGFVMGWRFSAVGLGTLYALAAVLAGAGWLSKRGLSAQSTPDSLPFTPQKEPGSAPCSWASACLISGWILILGWRLYQARLLALPAWVDSLHHVLIVRLILEQGGVPHTFAPYLPAPFYYHFGFHAAAASFALWSDLAPIQAVLWFGQVLNALVALAIYRLGLALWGDWRRAGLAGLLVGFVLQMPAYYLTWGRYTLLAGLVLLPLAMAEALEIARRGGNWRRAARLVVLTGGLLLTHYFAGLLLGLFLLVLGLQVLLGRRDEERPEESREPRLVRWVREGLRRRRLWVLVAGAAGGGLLACAWLVYIWGYAGAGVSVQVVTSVEALEAAFAPDYLDYLWRMLGPLRSHLLLALALPGLVVAGTRARTRALMAWAELLGLLSIPWGVQLKPFRPDHVVIVLFLPIALLAADFLALAGERLGNLRLAPGKFSRLVGWVGLSLVVLLIASLSYWGLKDTRNILNAATILATQADRQALAWVAENTPNEARFYINVTHWQGATYRGVDGGWWVMPATGRGTLLPPVLYAWSGKEYAGKINQLAEIASQVNTCSAAFWEVVHTAHLTHIYLVKGRGVLQPAGLQDCAGLSLMYAEQGVFIYEILE